MAIFSGNSDEIKVHIDRITPCVLENLALNGNKLKWTNDLERLKHFIEEIVGIKGKWSSPGGGSRRFKSQCGQFQVTWYFKKQSTLLFQGELAEDLAVKLKEAITKAIEDAENLAKHKDGASEVETSNFKHTGESLPKEPVSCSFRELTADVERVKLDMVKMEKRINAKLEAISNNAANEKPKENPKEDESRREIAHHEQTIQELRRISTRRFL